MSCGHECNCRTWGDHARSITFSATTSPTRTQNQKTINAYAAENSWKDDMPAYRRLRDDGLQPPMIEGSAVLEAKAADKVEVQDGRFYGKKLSLVKDVKRALGENV